MRNISALKIIQKLASIAEPQTPDSEEHEFMNACARSEQLHSYINDSSTHSDTHTHEHIKHQINSKRNALSSIKSVETARTHKIAIYSYVDGARCFFLFFVLFCFLFYFHFFIIFSWHPMVWKRTYTWSHLPVPVSVHNQQYVHQNEVENHHFIQHKHNSAVAATAAAAAAADNLKTRIHVLSFHVVGLYSYIISFDFFVSEIVCERMYTDGNDHVCLRQSSITQTLALSHSIMTE